MGIIHKKINQTERELLGKWKNEGISNKECGRRLHSHTSTIGRELRRNRFKDQKRKEYIYEPLHAHRQAEARKEKAWNTKQPLKNKYVYAYVMEKLRSGWSPEEIEGRLKVEYPHNTNWHISYETIYQYIYAAKNQEKKLWEYLPRKQKKRQKKYGRSVHRSHIPNRISIHTRAERINNRKEFGHFEGDTVEGRNHKDGIHTEVERVSRYLLAKLVKAITSEKTIAVQKEMFRQLPKYARRSTTLDNGKENHLHHQLQVIGMKTYFADPYSSWQRGTNENTNGLLRRYLPKKTSFANLTQEELDDIIYEINNRPRKVLQYQTPQEVFTKHLKKGCVR
jgi:IS30 family transposase